jgi:hypothetical protein
LCVPAFSKDSETICWFWPSPGQKIVLRQPLAQHLEGLLGRVGKLEELDVLGRDGAGIHQHVEVEDLLPILRAVDDDGDLLGQLLGLGQGEDLEHLVEGAEAAGKDHQRLGQVGKPQLAHEEVVELEVERWA